MSEQRTLPSEIGGYQVVGQLGHGSYGSVFRVRRQGLLRDFALKVLPADLPQADMQRFRREARLVARLDHPHVVSGFEFGRDRETGWHYLCLDLIEGPSLKQHLKKNGPLGWQRAIEVVVEVARAVDYAHQEGVIHRDLKPANVLLDRHGFVRVTDFGLARDLGELTLTAPGEVLGTPYYMSREQVQGHKATPLFDVHALGVILYELVTGERPYQGTSIAEVVGAILEGEPPRPSEHAQQALPRGFDAICQRAMAPDASQRYPSARALADALEELARKQPGPALARRKTPESVGLPAAAPRASSGALLGAGVACAALLPLLSLALVWGWTRGPAEDEPEVAAAVEPPPEKAPDFDAPRRLASILAAIEAWDLPQAKRELAQVRRRADAAHDKDVENLASLYADAVVAERSEVARLQATYTHRLRPRVALNEAEGLLRAHPHSADLMLTTGHLALVCGQPQRARKLVQGALARDDALVDDELTQTLLEELEEAGSGSASTGELWERWRPYQGGVWQIERGGAIRASGRGLGPYDLAGLLLRRQLPTSTPYLLQVEVSLGKRTSAYGGVLFGVSEVGEAYLAYLVRSPKSAEKHCSPTQLEALRAEGRGPLVLRVARLVEGSWKQVHEQLCQASDYGDGDVALRVEVEEQSITATVGGVREPPVSLPTRVSQGEVGLLSFYGGNVTYRDFRCSSH